MAGAQHYRNKTITDYHRVMELSRPQHPLISVIKFESIKRLPAHDSLHLINDFYSIGLKRNFNGRMKYGQQQYDFDEGIMTFMSPGQVLKIEIEKNQELKHSGWLLLFHPDLLWNTSLAKTIKQYTYFSYAVNEALHLSEKEEATITNIIQSIAQEYSSGIDKLSQDILVAQIEVLLKYAERFYERQFITRKITSHQLLNRLEEILSAYFTDELETKGLPTVNYIARTLNVSPGYLSEMLRVLTGRNTQQHIHDKLIEKAKEKLSVSDMSVSEIAYELGFGHPQSFSKLFKTKTNLSPLEFRQSFN